TYNRDSSRRILVTKPLPGSDWLGLLIRSGFSVDVCTMPQPILDEATLRLLLGERCEGVIGQLTENWGEELFAALSRAGGKAYSNFAVGYNNVDVDAATRAGVAVGTTPGVLTETTAELAVALVFAAARHTYEAEQFMRGGRYAGFLPQLFVGKRLRGSTLGVVGTGRIGQAFARMMVEGHKMNLIYFSFHRNVALEDYVQAYSAFLVSRGESPLSVRRVATVEELLCEADVASLHVALSDDTLHLIDAPKLALMKPDAILVNTARGPIVDEEALVAHLRTHPDFVAALDVFEREPLAAPGLLDLPNAVCLPHIGSATHWTRAGMAKLAACNVLGALLGYPVFKENDVAAFVDASLDDVPKACPSILNAEALGME
ncbi:D-isomer specific 2-hydroxyacid dehydrogenase, partial [Helicosporidium sp. ATCC 50920]